MEYLTTRETAEFLDVPKGTLDRWATSTEINKKIFPADDKDIRNGLKVNLFSKDRIVALKEFAGGQKITAEIVKNFNKRNDTTADFNFVDSAQIVIDTLLEYDKPDELIIADSVTFTSTTFENVESAEKVFTLDTEPSTSVAVISADSVIDIPADNLPQLTLEIERYLNQAMENYIEVGKRLIQARAIVARGEWQNWLEQNFNLSYRTAKNFMDIASRFAKLQTSATLKYSQMTELLRLMAGDEEKFIAEMAAKGTPIENMTIRELREKINQYNEKLKKVELSAPNIKELQDKKPTVQSEFEDNVSENQAVQPEIADSVTFTSTTFENVESAEKVFTLDTEPSTSVAVISADSVIDNASVGSDTAPVNSEPSTSLAVISADSVIDIPAEKDRAENDKPARAMAVADSLEIALGQLRRVFDDNLPAELDDIFKTLKEQISLIRRFLTSQD